MSWIVRYQQSEIGGMELKSKPQTRQTNTRRPDTQDTAGLNCFKTATKTTPRSIKSSSSVVRSEKHKYFREMGGKQRSTEDIFKFQARLNHDFIQTPGSIATKSRTIIPGEFNSQKSPDTQQQFSSGFKGDGDLFDKIGFGAQINNLRQIASNLNMCDGQSKAVSRQTLMTKTKSTSSMDYANPLMNAMHKAMKSKLRIQPRATQDNFFPERLKQIELQQKPQFHNILKKNAIDELYKSQDPQAVVELTKNMFQLYKKKEEDKAKKAFDFRQKYSLTNKFAEKLSNNTDIQFCKEVLDHLHRVKTETKIIPYSVASINPDNGLREKLPQGYVAELKTEAIDEAKSMVQQFQSRASQMGTYNDRISKETKSIRKVRISNTLKNAVDHLKSMNYQKAGELTNEQKELKEILFYNVKQNRITLVMSIIQDEPLILNLMDRNKMTVLHWAVKRNYLSLTEFLLKSGAKKDSQDVLGRTPLHFAAKLNYFEMTKNKKGLTALEVSGSDDITNMISKAKRLEVISKMSFKPMRALQDAERSLFRAEGDDSDGAMD